MNTINTIIMNIMQYVCGNYSPLEYIDVIESKQDIYGCIISGVRQCTRVTKPVEYVSHEDLFGWDDECDFLDPITTTSEETTMKISKLNIKLTESRKNYIVRRHDMRHVPNMMFLVINVGAVKAGLYEEVAKRLERKLASRPVGHWLHEYTKEEFEYFHS